MESTPQRIIAIVGRPNVGKSALFNRLVGRRVAIVHEQTGVTRDRLACEVTWDDDRFELLDTGGVGLIDARSTSDEIERGTREQVDVALEDASVVIFVTDITAGVVPLDQEVARLLHESGRTVFLAANKADNSPLEDNASEFESLGFPVLPVSALHGRGIDGLMDAALPRLPEAENVTATHPLKVAIVGRPNVGKSSYINRILRNDRLIVSEVPGTTRDSVEIPFTVGAGEGARHYLLVDTAGVRKQGRIKSAVDQFSTMRTERAIERCDVAVLMLNAEEGPTSRDKRMAAKILDSEKGCLLVVNKWDLSDSTTQRAYGKAMQVALPFLNFVPVAFVSAKSGYNIRRSIEAIDYVGAQVQSKLSTGILNRVIQDAFTRVSPPSKKGRRLKVFYATQTGTHPIRIRLFVNDPKAVAPAYRTYLVASLRKAFGLEGAPVALRFSARQRNQRS